MEKEKYESLLKDKSVWKIDTIGYGFFKDKNDCVAIQFLFMHAGAMTDFEIIPKKRIWLSAFPLGNLIKKIKPHVIGDYITILANSDIYEYALTYKLSINSVEKKIEIKIDEKPIGGERFITHEELDGIIAYY